jgi:serine/threonine protein kinase
MATPEYLAGGKITLKSDIYSLGVIIMQIITGQNKKNYSNTANVSLILPILFFFFFFAKGMIY